MFKARTHQMPMQGASKGMTGAVHLHRGRLAPKGVPYFINAHGVTKK